MRKPQKENLQSNQFETIEYIERLEGAYTNSIEYRSFYKRKNWIVVGLILVFLIAFGMGLIANWNRAHKKGIVETALLPGKNNL